MSKSENKTVPTAVSPRAFVEQVEPAVRRDDGLFLLDWFSDVTGWAPQMWGPSLIGFGRYHYKYDSGREGDFLVTGFSPRKANLVFYIMPGYSDLGDRLARLGPHKLGKACLYVTRLSRIDLTALEDIVRFGVEDVKARYKTWDA